MLPLEIFLLFVNIYVSYGMIQLYKVRKYEIKRSNQLDMCILYYESTVDSLILASLYFPNCPVLSKLNRSQNSW